MTVDIPDATIAAIRKFQCDERINDYTWERLLELAKRATCFEAATGIQPDFGGVIPHKMVWHVPAECHVCGATFRFYGDINGCSEDPAHNIGEPYLSRVRAAARI